MDDDQFAHALLEERAGGVAKGDSIQSAARFTDLKTCGFARFNFVEDAVVNVLQRGIDDFRETIAVLANDIDTGLYTRGLSGGQQARGFSPEFCIGFIQGIQQKEVT